MDPHALSQAQQVATDVLANVSADRMDRPTPCANWNLGQLIDHLVGAQKWASGGITGGEMEGAEGVCEGDFQAAFAEAAQATLDAFNEDGAMDRTVNPGFGDMPASALLGLAVTDTLTHAWDVARATGQNTDLAPELYEQVLASAHQAIPQSFRTEDGSLFGPEQPAPENADNATRLAAFLGRRV